MIQARIQDVNKIQQDKMIGIRWDKTNKIMGDKICKQKDKMYITKNDTMAECRLRLDE